MNNGKSRLIPALSANLLAAICFFMSLALGIFNSALYWLSPVMLLIALLLFLFESNSFVRKCLVQIFVYSLIAAISSIVFGKWFASIKILAWLFKTVDWLIRIIIGLFSFISGIQALSGKQFNPPVVTEITGIICSALRVY